MRVADVSPGPRGFSLPSDLKAQSDATIERAASAQTPRPSPSSPTAPWDPLPRTRALWDPRFADALVAGPHLEPTHDGGNSGVDWTRQHATDWLLVLLLLLQPGRRWLGTHRARGAPMRRP